jgi:hypothetical protein
MRELLTIRPATRDDVPALVELRLANAEAHFALDLEAYRVPPRAAVARHFTGVLAGGPDGDGVLVAETPDGRVVGMVEVVRSIHHRNAAAVRFSSRHGYADSGRSLGKRLA